MNMEKAKQLVSSLIKEFEDIKTERDSIKLDAFFRRARMIIKQIFGVDSEYIRDLNNITFLSMYSTEEEEERRIWENGWGRTNNLLSTMLEQLNISDFVSPEISQQMREELRPKTNKVFVVHGHDEAMKESVARTLTMLGLESIILHEKPNKGRTIIEKFFDYSDVSFAVVLLSPDDILYFEDVGIKKSISRARQNVILELGYFLGKIGRHHLVALHMQKENFEIPTDYSGVLFIPFDSSGAWRFNLVKELQACGFDVDANALTKN